MQLTKTVKFQVDDTFVTEKGLIEQLYHQLKADAHLKVNLKAQIDDPASQSGMSNDQTLANALMYSKIIRDYFLRIEEAPVIFGNQYRPGETPKHNNLQPSARFTFTENNEMQQADIESVAEEDKEDDECIEEMLDLPKVPSFDYNQSSIDSNPVDNQEIIEQIRKQEEEEMKQAAEVTAGK